MVLITLVGGGSPTHYWWHHSLGREVSFLREENGLSTSVAVFSLCSLHPTVGTRPLCSLSPATVTSPLGWAVAWDCELKYSCSRQCGLSQRMEWELGKQVRSALISLAES